LITLLAAIFVFGLLIFVHELGHFVFAKLTGMRVDEFAIGFGPKIIGYQYGETFYSLRIIPLGGYNKIAGMDFEEDEDERAYSKKPLWARAVMIFGGALMNFILPIILFTIIFSISGIDTPTEESILGQVITGRPAAQAGLQMGDRITAIDGQSVKTWTELVQRISSRPGHKLLLTVQRNSETIQTQVTPELDPNLQRGLIGVGPLIVHTEPMFIQSIGHAFTQTALILKEMTMGIVHMFTGKTAADVAGPLGVAQMAGQFAQMGIIPLLQFTAFVSLNLGLINLLPLPALDGGHIVLLALEGIRRKPISKSTLYTIQMIGFALILALVVTSTYKDIIRLKFF
jgi:regulator of sigma E protease